MTERSVVVVSAGIAQPSSTRLLADRLASATERRLREAAIEPRLRLIELRDLAHDLTNNMLTGFPSPALRSAVEAVRDADGAIAVSPIYSGSYNGLFKMFFDVLERDGLSGKPVLVAATGGTARHSLALEHELRPLFGYLNAWVVPTSVFAAPEDWGEAGDGIGRGLVARIDRAASELARAVALVEIERPRDEFSEPTPFEDLLAATRDHP